MKVLFFSLMLAIFSGCSATWSGVKEDTSNALHWTKTKVNEGAGYIKEKTE